MTSSFVNSQGRLRHRAWLILILAAGAFAQGCTTTRVSSDFDRGARFDGYRTMRGFRAHTKADAIPWLLALRGNPLTRN